MARRCDLCNKKAVSGHNVSYSKRRTARRFMPNLRFITLGGQRIKTCMKCLKKLKNEGKIVMKKITKVKEVVKVEPEVKNLKTEKPKKAKIEKKKTVKTKKI